MADAIEGRRWTPQTAHLFRIMGGADPATAAADWVAGLSNATAKIERGVDATRAAPGQLAARQADTWAANTQASKAKFARRVGSVTLSDWQNAMKSKGIPRIASGASASEAKMAAFLSAFLPHVERVRASLPARGNFDQNVARMTAFVRGVHGFTYGGS